MQLKIVAKCEFHVRGKSVILRKRNAESKKDSKRAKRKTTAYRISSAEKIRSSPCEKKRAESFFDFLKEIEICTAKQAYSMVRI